MFHLLVKLLTIVHVPPVSQAFDQSVPPVSQAVDQSVSPVSQAVDQSFLPASLCRSSSNSKLVESCVVSVCVCM